MPKCYVLLLGGIGSGKSSAAQAFLRHGAEVIDADEIGHEILNLSDVVHEVAARWPPAVVGGTVDRRRLGEIVFGDRSELRRLEAITHPRIASRLAERIRASTNALLIVEMPLLADLVRGEWIRIVVDAPIEVRLSRLGRRGMTESDALARIEAQPQRAEFLAIADHVIDNSRELVDLDSEISRLIQELGCFEEESGRPIPSKAPKHHMLPQ